MSRARILQVFSRYEHYGGEEASVTRIGDIMQRAYDVEYFLGSTSDLMRPGVLNKLQLPLRMLYNQDVKKRLLHYQKAGRFDYWQVHNVFPGMSPVVYYLAENLGIPVVQYLHNYRFSCSNGFFLNHGQPCQLCIKGNFFPAFETACWRNNAVYSGAMGFVLSTVRWKELFSKINRFIAISHRQKALHIEMGVPAEKIDVIYHFAEPVEAAAGAQAGGHALFIGRLSAEKGGMHLLRAWQKIQHHERKLFIVGDGPEKQRMEEFCQQNALKNVVFTGFLKSTEQQEIWDNAAFTLVPSIWEEPFGLVVLESWARKIPVIAHRIGALPELISDEQDGLLCNPNSPESLAACMDTFFSDHCMTRDCGMAGYRKLLSDFNANRWLDEIKATYSRLP
ncbi:MAG: glycosyltransferase family 4 protein [Chthoniobacterales bacterium]